MSRKIDFVQSEKIIVACRLMKHENVFSLNASGHRGAISFQQHRAFLLATAIESFYGHTGKGKKIAVIGGGVAGVTIAAALHQMEFEKVQIFEAKELLHKQKYSDKRLVHPDYNRWPMLGGLNNFTNFKLLNWVAAPASEVIETIRYEFEKIASGQGGNFPLKVCENMRLVRCKQLENEDQIRLGFKNEQTNDDFSDDFDFVIICTGQGVDSSDLNYWNSLSQVRSAVGNDKIEHVKIFGSGDSALIDTFNCFMKDQDDAGGHIFWNMMLGFASVFRQKQWTQVIVGDYHAGDQSTLSQNERRIRAHEATKRPLASSILRPDSVYKNLVDDFGVLNEQSKVEQKFYLSIINDYCEKAHEHFDEFLVSKGTFCPTKIAVYGLLETPFQPTQAPINKLFLAFLLHNEMFTYCQVTAQESMDLLDKCHSMSDEQKAVNPYAFHIGSQNNTSEYPTVEEIFGITEFEKLVSNMLNFSTSIDAIAMDAFSIPTDKTPIQKGLILEYIPLVEKFFSRLGVEEVLKPTDEREEFQDAWVVHLKSHEQASELEKKLKFKGGLEPIIAGCRIRWELKQLDKSSSVAGKGKEYI